MQYYAAPLEGITGYIYRNAHHHHFRGVDKYFTPFLTPKAKKGWSMREKNDILPEHNQGICVVPQIMTNKAEDFLLLAERLKEYGYTEVNLNLGCPSGTVVAKGKGCGFLADTEELKRFFETVFSRITMKVSVKSRLGFNDPGEIAELMEVYNQFPLEELILHARIYKDFYKRPVNLKAFQEGLAISKNEICYNGDLFSEKDYNFLVSQFPSVKKVMFGRGFISNPQFVEELSKKTIREKKRWRAFHDELCDGYEEIMSGERNVLFKMKEVWSYMIPMFEDGQRYGKKIKKANHLSEYKDIVDALFEECNLTVTE